MDNPTTVNSESIKYGGFWRRLIALIIDLFLVTVCVFPLIVAIDFFFPNQLVVTTPLGLFSEERILETEKGTLPNPDGSQTAVETKIVQKTYMNKWTYTYRVVEKSIAGESKSESQLIDPVTKQAIGKTSTNTIELLVLLIYLILMEGSRYQASLGKIALGLKVVDKDGNSLTFLRAAGRNVSKLLSVFTLFIGFMMAGWTNKKQALHDMVAGCLVIRA
jgi:uncharacterized RDD family membrane protein YckC